MNDNTCEVIREGNKEIYYLSSNKEVTVIYGDDSIKVMDCHLLDKEERRELIANIYANNKDKSTLIRSVNNALAELTLHSYLYRIGIEKASTKDADLDYIKDNRWYVTFFTSIIQILGV